MRNLVLLFFLPLLAAAQTTVIQRGGSGGGSVAAGSGISVATNGSVYTISATGTASNAQPPSVQLTNVSNGALYANTNWVTNLLTGFGTNNFLLAQSRTNIVTNWFELDYLSAPDKIAMYMGRGLTSSVINATYLLYLTNNVLTNLAGLSSTNQLVDTNEFRLYTNSLVAGAVTGLVNAASVVYPHTNAGFTARPSGFFHDVDMRPLASPYVTLTVTTNFTIWPTNIPTLTNYVTSVNVRYLVNGGNWTLTVPAAMSFRCGGTYSNAFVLSNNTSVGFTITAYGNPNNGTHSNVVWSIGTTY